MFVLGDGSRISFEKDIWCREDPLYGSLPAFYNLTVTKEAKVANVWDISKGEGA